MIKKICMLLGLCLLLAGMNPDTAAAAEKEKQKENKKIDIVLKEYTVDENGKEVPWKDIKNALPGQTVIKIPRVTNLESECNVRAKIEVTMEKDVEKPVREAMIRGIPKEWKKREDGWYYYDRPLKEGETVDIFHSFTIPPDWETRYGKDGRIEKYYTENVIDVIVTVEASGKENWKKPDKRVSSPKTGDHSEILKYASMCIATLAVGSILFKRKRS